MKKIVYWLLPLVVLSIAISGYAQLQVPGADNTPKLGEKPPEHGHGVRNRRLHVSGD